MAGAKREPSSLVQLMISMGALVSYPNSCKVRTASNAASTPNTPSNLPPVGCVSRWLPMASGASPCRRPGRLANIFPTSSTVTAQPAASAAVLNQSRTCLSSSVNVSRLMPPFKVRPKFAVSISVSQRRWALIFRFCMVSPAPPRSSRGNVVALHPLRGGEFAPCGIGDVSGRKRSARYIFPGSGFGPKVSVEPRDPAARQRRPRQAPAGISLEHVVIDAADLRFRRNGLGGVRIPDDEVGVRPDRHRAFARVDVEDASDVRGRYGDKLLPCEPPGVDAGRPQHRQAVFETSRAVRDFDEIGAAKPLLGGGERTMVGRYDLE